MEAEAAQHRAGLVPTRVLPLLRAGLPHPKAEPFGGPSCLQSTQGLLALLCLKPASGGGHALGCSVEVTWHGVPTPLPPCHHLFPSPSVLHHNSTHHHPSDVTLSIFLPSLVIHKLQENLGATQPKPSQEKLLLCKAGTGLKVHVWCICWLHQGADDAPCRILLSQLVGGSLPPLMPCVGLEVVWRNMAAAPVPPQTLTPFHLLLSSTSTILTSEWP